MDTKLQDALKKANAEIEKASISDPELRKIAFSKAVDFYLGTGKDSSSVKTQPTPADIKKSDFWSALAISADIEEKKLKDVYTLKGEQVLLVMSLIPGESKADKQRSLAVLVLFAYSEGLGKEWLSSGLLAEAAQHSKLYDTSKFAKNLKYDWFRSEGVKKGLKYKLSGPGLIQAKSILKSLTQ